MIPRQRSVADVDAEIRRAAWVRDQAIGRFDGDVAAFETGRIDELLDERLALTTTDTAGAGRP